MAAMDYLEEQAKNGRKGGKTTLAKYGVAHFAKAGKKGGKKRKVTTKI